MIATALLFAKSAISRLLSAITANPWPSAVIALALLSAWLWHGKADYREQLATEQAGRKADRAEWDRNVASPKQSLTRPAKTHRRRQLKLTRPMTRCWRITLALSAISLTIACSPKPVPQIPPAPVKVLLPGFLKSPPPCPEWRCPKTP